MSHHLVGAAEVAGILGVSRRRVAEIATEAPDFPAPEAVLSAGRIWSREAVEAWAAQHQGEIAQPERAGPVRSPRSSQARKVMRLAGDEAKRLNHGWIGVDHLALALLHPDCPGKSAEVLSSFGVDLAGARQTFVDGMRDPYTEPVHWQKVTTAVQLTLERASLKAAELGDAEVSSEHVLLALTDDWPRTAVLSRLMRSGVDAESLRDRVLAVTEGLSIPEGDPLAPPSPKRPLKSEVPLAPTPSGQDPRRREPWGSAVFADAEGRPATEGGVLRQYLIDRDGNPVLTVDGRPVHVVHDSKGQLLLDEMGGPTLVPVEIPSGCEVKRFPSPR